MPRILNPFSKRSFDDSKVPKNEISDRKGEYQLYKC